MRRLHARVIAVAIAATGCGARVGDDVDASTYDTDVRVEEDTHRVVDVGADDAPGRTDGASLGACERDNDCVGSFTTCQRGSCCNGHLSGSRCTCGAGAGCLPWWICCRSGDTNAEVSEQCVRDVVLCAR